MPDVVHFGSDDERPTDLQEIERRLGTEREALEAAVANPTEVKAAMALWLAGATYGDIAEQMKFRTPAQARMMIERALADTVDDTQDRTVQRRKVSLQLDRLLRAVIVKALDPDAPEQLANARMVLSILERKSRLLGLDAPIQAIVANPTGDELDRWLSEVAKAQGIAVPEEGDPFATYVVEESKAS